MMKKYITIVLLILSVQNMYACDICGSGVGGGYIGLLPGFHKRFMSLRYSQNGLVSHIGQDGTYSYLTSRETFRVAEAWGAVNIGSRFRIAGFVPVNFMERTNGTGHYTQSGLGDVTAIGYYQLFNKEKEADKTTISQSLWAGAGIKAPTGKYNPDEKSIRESTQNTFQLGTGSLDFSAHLMYDLRVRNAGLNINSSYKLNTRNRYDYQYGNKFTVNALVYYKIRITDKVTVLPNTGLLYEQSAKDEKIPSVKVWETGGYSSMGTAGLEFSFGRIGAGANLQMPLDQHLGEGKVKARDRGMAYLSFSF